VDTARAGRAAHRAPLGISTDGAVVRAEVPGSEGAIWHPRINVAASSFGCDCPDHSRRKVFKGGAWTFKGGPCKHVAALAVAMLAGTPCPEEPAAPASEAA
jgi:hypothetical protein